MFQKNLGHFRMVAEILKETFISKVKEVQWTERVNVFMNNIDESNQNQQKLKR